MAARLGPTQLDPMACERHAVALGPYRSGLDEPVENGVDGGQHRGHVTDPADVVAFIYREEVYNPDPATQGLAELIIAKQRNGPIGNVPLAFLKQFTAFKDREDRDDPGEPWG